MFDKKCVGWDLKCPGQRVHSFDADVALAPFDSADIIAMQVRELRQGFLAEFPGLSEAPDGFAEFYEIRITVHPLGVQRIWCNLYTLSV